MTRWVWYVAYGSNMHASRLHYYLAGGQPPGAARTYPGCRDPRPPARTAPVFLPGGIYFALESLTWTGGMAFYDPELPGRAAARAYLLTASQFADIAAQEMVRSPGEELDLAEVLSTGRAELGPGRYETLVCPGWLGDHPMLTFTAPWRARDVEWNPPSPRYVGMIASGLHEAHGWGAERLISYLSERPGIHGQWGLAELAERVSRIEFRWMAAAASPDDEEFTRVAAAEPHPRYRARPAIASERSDRSARARNNADQK